MTCRALRIGSESWLITLVGVQVRVGREPKGPGASGQVCIERPSAALPPEVMSSESWLITLVGVQVRVGREPKGPGASGQGWLQRPTQIVNLQP